MNKWGGGRSFVVARKERLGTQAKMERGKRRMGDWQKDDATECWTN